MPPPAHATTTDVLLDRQFVRSLIRFETLRTGSALHDEDLEQDVLLRLFLACRRVGFIQYPQAFAAKVVRDIVHDHWRSRRTLFNLDLIPENLLSYRPQIDERIDYDRNLELLEHSLDRLSQPKRETIELFYLSEYSVGDIAQLHCCSPSAVKMTLMRTRQELQRILHIKPV